MPSRTNLVSARPRSMWLHPPPRHRALGTPMPGQPVPHRRCHRFPTGRVQQTAQADRYLDHLCQQRMLARRTQDSSALPRSPASRWPPLGSIRYRQLLARPNESRGNFHLRGGQHNRTSRGGWKLQPGVRCRRSPVFTTVEALVRHAVVRSWLAEAASASPPHMAMISTGTKTPTTVEMIRSNARRLATASSTASTGISARFDPARRKPHHHAPASRRVGGCRAIDHDAHGHAVGIVTASLAFHHFHRDRTDVQPHPRARLGLHLRQVVNTLYPAREVSDWPAVEAVGDGNTPVVLRIERVLPCNRKLWPRHLEFASRAAFRL